jgi:hypothetical protein
MELSEIQQQINTLNNFLSLILNHINKLETQLKLFMNAVDVIDEVDEEDEEEDY